MAEKCIELKGITKAFDGQIVLDHMNLDIHENEFVTLLGPSGCGKTTTLRIMGGFETADEGQVLLNGTDIARLPANKRPINTVFQKYALFSHMNIEENIAFGLKIKKKSKDYIRDKIKYALKLVNLDGYEKRMPDSLSGGQQQRIAIARAIVNEPKILLLDEPLGALDLKMRQGMQYELIRLKEELGITFVYVTHDQEEALTMSDTIVVMNQGYIQQIGTPEDIYNEPQNAFVADFIGESNILSATMVRDRLVNIQGQDFECVDVGFGENKPVDVVIRPEDMILVPPEKGTIRAKVKSLVFKGVHYEMTVLCGGYEFLVQDYHHFEVGAEVGLLVKPFDIHIMKKERVCNTFEGKLQDATHVEFLGCTFECASVEGLESGTDVKVEVDFDKVILQDNEEDGTLTGEVKFILYKGDHYHLTVWSDWDENVFVDTNDVWDDGDRVGITIPPDAIRVIKITD